MRPLLYTWVPGRAQAAHPRIVECLLAMNRSGWQEAVWQCIQMYRDVREHGRSSRYVRALRGLPGLHELKPTTRGGQRGGARVYLFWSADGSAVLVNAEYKAPGEGPSERLLEEAYETLLAFRKARGKP